MGDMRIFSTKAFHFDEFLNLAVDRIYSGSRPPWSSEKREKENGCLSSDNVRWKIFVRTQGASQVPNTVKTPLWFIFAEMLMSGESDSGFGNRIVPTVCKVYNVICVSDMKGRVLLEKNTREACKKPPVVCRRRGDCAGFYCSTFVSCKLVLVLSGEHLPLNGERIPYLNNASSNN